MGVFSRKRSFGGLETEYSSFSKWVRGELLNKYRKYFYTWDTENTNLKLDFSKQFESIQKYF